MSEKSVNYFFIYFRFFYIISILCLKDLSAIDSCVNESLIIEFDKIITTKETDLPFPISRKLVDFDGGYGISIGVNKALNEQFELGLNYGYRKENQKLSEVINDGSGNTMLDFHYHNKMNLIYANALYNLDLGIFIPYFGLGYGIAKVRIDIDSNIRNSFGIVEKRNADSVVDKWKFAYLMNLGVFIPVAYDFYIGLGSQYFFMKKMDKNDISSAYSSKDYLEDILNGRKYKIETGELSLQIIAKLTL